MKRSDHPILSQQNNNKTAKKKNLENYQENIFFFFKNNPISNEFICKSMKDYTDFNCV